MWNMLRCQGGRFALVAFEFDDLAWIGWMGG